MPQIRYYAPEGVNVVNLLEGDKPLFVKDGYITADSKFALELLKAGFTPIAKNGIVASGDASGNVVILKSDGTTLLTIDVLGNLIASVNHRTGTLAYLLGLSGGLGEIAVATDRDSLVVYGGGVMDGVEFSREVAHVMTKLGVTATLTNVSTTLYVPLLLNGTAPANYDASAAGGPGLWGVAGGNPTDYEVRNPFYAQNDINEYTAVEVMGGFSFPASPLGVARKVRLEYNNSLTGDTGWAALGSAINLFPDVTATGVAAKGFIMINQVSQKTHARYRLAVNTDAEVALSVVALGAVTFEFSRRPVGA